MENDQFDLRALIYAVPPGWDALVVFPDRETLNAEMVPYRGRKTGLAGREDPDLRHGAVPRKEWIGLKSRGSRLLLRAPMQIIRSDRGHDLYNLAFITLHPIIKPRWVLEEKCNRFLNSRVVPYEAIVEGLL